MAELNTSQKAPIVVSDSDGNVLPVSLYDSGALVVADSTIAEVDWNNLDTFYLVALAAGATTLTVNAHDGRTGSLDLTVIDAPLVLTLGIPEPR